MWFQWPSGDQTQVNRKWLLSRGASTWNATPNKKSSLLSRKIWISIQQTFIEYIVWSASLSSQQMILYAWQWKKIPIKKKKECTLRLRRTHLEFSLHLPFLGRDVMTVYKQAPLNTQTSVVHSLLFNQAQCFSIVIVTKNYDYIPIWLIAFFLYQQFYSSNKQLHS